MTGAHPLRVLLIEDNAGDARLLREFLGEADTAGWRFEWVDRLDAGLDRLCRPGIDVVLLDLSLPDSHGLDTFTATRAQAPAVPIVVLSGLADEAIAMAAVQAGAQDYLVKGQVDGPGLARAVRYAIERQRAAAAQELLARVGMALTAALDETATTPAVARLLAPALADWCLIDLVSPHGALTRAAAHADPAQAALMDELRHLTPGSAERYPYASALRAGQLVLVEPVPDGLLAELVGTPEQRAPTRELAPTALALAPLLGPARADAAPLDGPATATWLGVLVLARTAPGSVFDAAELALGREVAARCALAIDNARLYQAACAAIGLRDAVLASVTHDLKSPLATISGWAQVLQRRRDHLELPVVEQALADIVAATTRMRTQIDELLDVARLQAGTRLLLDRQPVDLVALARGCVAAHQRATERHQVQVLAAVPELVGVWDAPRLERVLANLLMNAITYSPAGGSITVTVALEENADGAAWAVLAVRDQGLGIPAAELPRITERFYRASNVAGRIRGTGVGLASAAQIIAQHGGMLAITSQEGQGTTVTIRLPLAPPEASRTDMLGPTAENGDYD